MTTAKYYENYKSINTSYLYIFCCITATYLNVFNPDLMQHTKINECVAVKIILFFFNKNHQIGVCICIQASLLWYPEVKFKQIASEDKFPLYVIKSLSKY